MFRFFFNRGLLCTALSLLSSSQIVALPQPNHYRKESKIRSEKRLLTKDQASAYAVELVNRDRAKFGIKPVAIDQGAMVAGQNHSDEMATYGFLSHWNLLGKKPIQRYSEIGGADYSSENVGLTAIHSQKNAASKAAFRLDSNHNFSSTDLEEFEHDFMSEKPPNDGHKQQILDPAHNKLGVGISFSELDGQSRISIAQEFVNHYGVFARIPSSLKRNTSFVVSGQLPNQISLDEVKIEREPLPQPQTPAQLDNGPRSSSYNGLPILEYFAGKDSQLKVWKEHSTTKFSVQIQIDSDWESGLYYILIWARTHESGKKRILISARTAQLE